MVRPAKTHHCQNTGEAKNDRGEDFGDFEPSVGWGIEDLDTTIKVRVFENEQPGVEFGDVGFGTAEDEESLHGTTSGEEQIGDECHTRGV